jgi:hypothetical protein
VRIDQDGKLSGSATIIGESNGLAMTLAVIPASGYPPKNSTAFQAGSDGGWALSVTYNTNGTATATASGSWSGITSTGVNIEVDA